MARGDRNFMVVVDVEARRGCCTRKRRDFARDRPATQAPIFGLSASSAFVELSSWRTDPACTETTRIIMITSFFLSSTLQASVARSCDADLRDLVVNGLIT